MTKAAPKPAAKAAEPTDKKATKAAPKPAAKTRRFNPAAAYGTIHPPYKGAVHEQDGGYFGPAGNLLWETHPATSSKKIVTEVMVSDGGVVQTETVETEIEDIEPGIPKDILKGWLTGQFELDDTKVRDLVKEGYNQVLVDRDEIIGFLVNTANLVPAEQVKVS